MSRPRWRTAARSDLIDRPRGAVRITRSGAFRVPRSIATEAITVVTRTEFGAANGRFATVITSGPVTVAVRTETAVHNVPFATVITSRSDHCRDAYRTRPWERALRDSDHLRSDHRRGPYRNSAPQRAL